jgi:hypothetical protein
VSGFGHGTARFLFFETVAASFRCLVVGLP